jgi:hypothetical protein
MRGDGVGGRVAGFQPMSAYGAQINFEDLTPYLTAVLYSRAVSIFNEPVSFSKISQIYPEVKGGMGEQS